MCLLLLLAAIAALYPPVFQAGLRNLAKLIAWGNGIELEIGNVTGSVLEPIAFTAVKMKSASPYGTVSTLGIGRLEASFSAENLLLKRGVGWLRKLVLEDVDAAMELTPAPPVPETSKAATEPPETRKASWFPFPASIEVLRANLTVRQGGNLFRFGDFRLSTSDVEAGELYVDEIEIHEPWLTKRFVKVAGTVAMRGERIILGDVALDPDTKIEGASASLPDLLKGSLAMDFDIAAFGGKIRGGVNSVSRKGGHLNFEATGSFSQISIATLAGFLDSPDIAGGVIKEGKFTFSGSPRDPERATLSTRLEATDFRWGERQWNSLVLGATMVERRLQLHEFRLQQAHNALSLKGEIAIPGTGGDWLQSEFTFDIKAQIDNLTELSALFGPGFADMAGKLTIDGAVRGHNRLFDGQLIISGSRLSYRTAPLDVLQAAIKLNGNELEIVHCEFAHKDDYLRGKGTLNIFGERQYSGEIKATIADLALYSAFMQPPVAPQAFAGGLSVTWSGDGSARAHSGAFQAQLKKVRPLVPTAANAFVLDADLEATYAPQNIFFSKFVLGNGNTSFAATVTASPASLNLQTIRVLHKKNVCLEGDALLPINVWGAWQNPTSTEFWKSDGECKLKLTAKNLDLHETLALSGRDLAMKGEITGTLTTEGTLASPVASGQAKLTKGEIPIAAGIVATEAAVSLADQNLAVEKFVGRIAACDFSASGNVDLHNRIDPGLKLNVQSRATNVAPRDFVKLRADLDLDVAGSWSAARVSGTARLTNAEVSAKLDWLSLILFEKHRDFEIDPPLTISQAPFNNWNLDVQVTSAAPLKLSGNLGVARPDLSIRGLAAEPDLAGNIVFEKMAFSSGTTAVTVERAAFHFEKPKPRLPILDVHCTARASGYDIDCYLFGSLDEKQVLLASNPPLPEQTIFRLLVRGFAPKSAAEQLPDFLEGVPFTLDCPFLPDGKDQANTLFNMPTSEDTGFSLHSALCPPQRLEEGTTGE